MQHLVSNLEPVMTCVLKVRTAAIQLSDDLFPRRQNFADGSPAIVAARQIPSFFASGIWV